MAAASAAADRSGHGAPPCETALTLLRMLRALAGMATHLEPADQERMLALFQAFSRLDGREIGDCTLLFSGDKQARAPYAHFRPTFHTVSGRARGPRGSSQAGRYAMVYI